MDYDPIKLRLARLLKTPALRRFFHLALDLLFLRAWYVRRELRRISDLDDVQTPSKIPHSALRIPHLLDAGMGFGQYSDRLLRMFPDARLVGLEIDRAHLYGAESYFRARHPNARIVLGDVRQMPLAADQFDFALTVDVMEHIDDDRVTFTEFHRVLKPGGALVIHTPRIKDEAPSLPAPTHEQGKRWCVGEHVRDGYRESEARERLEAAGFRIVRIVRGYGRWGMFAWTLLQRVPLAMLGASRWLAPVAALYLLPALPIGLLAMWMDIRIGDHPDGGSLLIVAQKPHSVTFKNLKH